jgi:hypothetical protein
MDNEQRRRQKSLTRRQTIIQQLQERNQNLENTIEQAKRELNLNRTIIDEFIADQEEKYSTSAEDISIEELVEIIPSPVIVTRQPKKTDQLVFVTAAMRTTTANNTTKTKKEERKESFQRASSWALERKRNKKR